MTDDVCVTTKVRVGVIDDEIMEIEKCVCGEEFGSMDFIISVYREHPYSCPKCGRHLYFLYGYRIMEVKSL